MSTDEAWRLGVLRSYAALDAPEDATLDRVTELARLTFNVPIALVSLVDEDRQWFASRQGLDACETDRDQAFCAHALPLARGGVLIVPDATRDPRFAAYPNVTGPPHIRFYAGAVLTSPEGANLGTLCLIDTQPRGGLTDLQHQTLRALADLVMSELEVRRVSRADAAKRAMLELAESMAGVGHWRVEVATGRIEWSREVYRIHGVDPASFQPTLHTALDFFDPRCRPAVQRYLEAAMREGQGFDFGLQIVRRDGERRDVVCRSTGEHGERGELVALVGVFQDVTEQKRLLKQVSDDRERYRLLTQNATDVIATYRPDGVITYISPAAERILGHRPATLVGTTTYTLIDPADHARVTAEFRALAAGAGASSRIEYRALRADGRSIWVEAHPTPLRDAGGRLVGFQDVVRDITARKTMELELADARERAEAAAQAKGDFLANMSHELRTPLTSILGFTALAGEQPELAPLTRDYVRRVHNASRSLLNTVNDILDFSKLEAGEVMLREAPTDVAALCREAVELFAPQADAKDLRLRVRLAGGPPPPLMLDAERLLQVLLNLVGNAVKFTAAGDVCLVVRHAPGRLRLEVRDTGPGIAPEVMDRLFKRFSQVDGSLSRAHGGTGLGLAICKGLAERMGGSIAVRSRVGEGSVFTIDLPAAVAAEAPGASCARDAGARMRQLDALRVLVVDDNAANRELARVVLAGAGAEVSQAPGGRAALALLATQPVDAVLLDLRMPDLTGRAVLAELRSRDGPNTDIPVIAYTADASDREVVAAFDGVAVKPVNPVELLRTVRRAIEADAGLAQKLAHG